MLSSTVYTATFTPSGDGATTIDVAANTFTDSSGNNNTAASQFNWTYDTAVPTMAITSSTVSDGATSSDSTIAMIFTSSKATTNFVIGDITVVGGALSSFNAASSTVYTATFTPSGNGAKTIDVAGGAFTDSLATIIQPPLSLTGPMTARCPNRLSSADNATGVGVNANIVLTFSEVVDVESGNITIKKTSDNSTIETIAVGSSKVSGTGTNTITINPAATLAVGIEYYVLIDTTAFDDPSGNSYPGISSTTALSFTTVADSTDPTLSSSSPVNGARKCWR